MNLSGRDFLTYLNENMLGSIIKFIIMKQRNQRFVNTLIQNGVRVKSDHSVTYLDKVQERNQLRQFLSST